MAFYLHLHISLVFFELLYFNFSTASCNQDQRQICLQAVTEKRLNWLSTGGECITKQYVQYTHLCTVFNYFPSVDYCCCHLTSNLMSSVSQKIKRSSSELSSNSAIDRNISRLTGVLSVEDGKDYNESNRKNGKNDDEDIESGEVGEDGAELIKEQFQNAALCCRYHQNWDHFRCLESEDALIPSPVPTTQQLLNRFKSSDFYVGGLVVAGFIFLSLGVICVLKMWKYKRLRLQEEKEWIEKDTSKKPEKKPEGIKEKKEEKEDSQPPSSIKMPPSEKPVSINIQYRQQPTNPAANQADSCKYGNLNNIFEDENKQPSIGLPSDQASLSNFNPKIFLPVRGSTTSDYFSYFDYANAHLYADSLENDSYSSCKNDNSDCSSYSSGETSEEPERHPYYSFYRRRVLGMDARQPPCATNAASSFGAKNGLHRHYRRHSRNNVNFRHHQLKRQRHLSYCPPSSTLKSFKTAS